MANARGTSSPPSPGGRCPFCGLQFAGSPEVCSRCGTLLRQAREDIRREGKRARKALHTRKAMADLFFLVGLLLGGPMMTLGGEVRLGLFIVLAGGVASVLRRYSEWSTPGTVVVGVLTAALVATWVVEPVREMAEDVADVEAGEEGRRAFVTAWAGEEPDIVAEARGPGAITLWLRVPAVLAGECGSFPPQEVRTHLAELGFRRVVVADRSRAGGLCSFTP